MQETVAENDEIDAHADAEAPSLRHQSYDRIMSALIDRKIRPGRLLSQREIAEITECTLSSVREALKWLEAEGIVTLIPKRGVEFREVSIRTIEEAYQLRKIIELAALPAYLESFDEAELKSLRKQTLVLVREQESGERSSDHFVRRLEIDRELHENIVGALGNDLVREAHARNDSIFLLARLSLPSALFHSGPAMKEHVALIDAILRRDAVAARDLLDHHLSLSCQRAVDALS